ncbi:hypothetical protein CDD81_3196 [Ophiocordyceps australis]|uniref:Ecp2 effector protein domain-containing protein n=1 Tax=Ophiocordyceps australis TaxID=1399860 RepID=A0A2C5XVG6_9HYPO|nr:hypothetical protein CDD81_3196 [Ophiocordyceps australis]
MKTFVLLLSAALSVFAAEEQEKHSMARDATPMILENDIAHLAAMGEEVGVVKEMTWSGQMHSAKDNHTYIGTIEQIAAVMEALGLNPLEEEDGFSMAPGTELKKRDVTSVECFHGQPTGIRIIREGIKYLNGRRKGGGYCFAPAKKRGRPGCSRVSCSNGGGIFLCNKTDDDYFNVPCKDIAHAAEALIEDCWVPDGLGSKVYVRGKANLSKDAYVLVTKTDC